VIEIRQTELFCNWLMQLADLKAAARIQARIDRLALGIRATPSRSATVSERCASITDPGYRVYYLRRARTLVILLCGGDKATQDKDIKRAKTIARQLQE